MSVPAALSRGAIDEELPALKQWAARHRWAAHLPDDGLILRFATYHPLGTLMEVTADLHGYPAQPPAWRFVVPGTDTPGPFPAPGSLPGAGGSIFHGNRVICAPWNRCAYRQADPDGVHDDWPLEGWQDVTGVTRALTIADMVDQIRIHLGRSERFL